MSNTIHVLSRLDAAGIGYIKQNVQQTAQTAKQILNATAHCRFLNWTPTPNEVMVNTGYAMLKAPVHIPLAMSHITGKESAVHLDIAYTITQAVFRIGRRYFPHDEVDPGHSYLCVLHFPAGIPDTIKTLSVFHDDRLPATEAPTLLLS